MRLENGTATFDEKSGDIKGPLFGGAVYEKSAANRLVVIGSRQRVRQRPDQLSR